MLYFEYSIGLTKQEPKSKIKSLFSGHINLEDIKPDIEPNPSQLYTTRDNIRNSIALDEEDKYGNLIVFLLVVEKKNSDKDMEPNIDNYYEEKPFLEEETSNMSIDIDYEGLDVVKQNNITTKQSFSDLIYQNFNYQSETNNLNVDDHSSVDSIISSQSENNLSTSSYSIEEIDNLIKYN